MIASLRLQNFRSYTDRLFKFASSANIIVGPNTAGKTNIIEAILVARIGGSYRTSDVNLISFNKTWTRIDCIDDDIKRTIKIKRDQTPPKSFEINTQVYKRLPAALKLPIVLFEPNHLGLLNGPPEGRRAYLDNLIEQIDSEYGKILRKYTRAISQRNALLKNTVKPTNNQMFPWNIRISQLAGQIVSARYLYIAQINNKLPGIYSKLSGDKVKTTIIYKPQLPVNSYESHYLKMLETSLSEDLRIGFTTYGPHRDDLVFMFNNHYSNTYASRGELRTAILALKVTELEIIKIQAKSNPIVLLDDVYSELDSFRRKALTGYLKTNQTFITTTDADVVSSNKSAIIKL